MKNDPKDNLKALISVVLKKKKANKQISKDIIQKIHAIIKKKSLYSELRKELNYKMKLNETYKVYLEQIVDLKNDIKQSKETIEIVCRRIKKECKSYIILMKDYDQKIEILKQKNEFDRKKYNERINHKEKEQNDLIQMLNNTIEKTKKQENKIKEDLEMIKNHDDNLERDRNDYIEKENELVKRIECLKENIKRLSDFLSAIQKPKPNNEDISQRILYQEDMKM